ncbi:phage repressor protein C with HTH and peptisase S24 domain [Oxalobacteraceae bacterium GrIS 1.11]
MKREDIRRENARALAAKVGGLAEFGRKTGMENSQVSQLIGKTPTKNIGNMIAQRIESAFELEVGSLDTPSVLDGDELEALLPGAKRVIIDDASSPEFYQIPKVMLRLSAGLTGFRTEPDLRDGGTIGVPRNWADRKGYNPAQLISIQVKGESMEPTFYEDDTVVINLADKTPTDNGVFAINYEGEPVIKRISRDIGEWWLTSDNSDQRKYHRKLCRSGECIVIGRVVRRETDQF